MTTFEGGEVLQSLYSGLLERGAGAAELDPWIKALDSGMALDEIVREIALSQERQSMTTPLGADASGLTRRELIQILYRGLLNRDPQSDELRTWLTALEHGFPLVEMIREVTASPERAMLTALSLRPLPPPLEDGPELTIVDVGAQVLPGEEDVFRPLLDGGRCRVIGFEPLEESHEARLRQDPSWVLLPNCVGDGAPRHFHRTEWGPTSSLYRPNFEGLDDFADLHDLYTVAESVPVETARLDDLIHERIDLIKLDVQGAELDVLRGAERLLGDVLVIHTEVEFFPMYESQPLFDDLFRFLLDREFEMFDFSRLIRYSYRGQRDRQERLLWGEVVFIPSRSRIGRLDSEATHRLARIMHDAYGAVGFKTWLLGGQTKP